MQPSPPSPEHSHLPRRSLCSHQRLTAPPPAPTAYFLPVELRTPGTPCARVLPHLSFWVWLLSLGNMCSRPVHVQLVHNPLPLQANILLCGRTTFVLPSFGLGSVLLFTWVCKYEPVLWNARVLSGLSADCSPQPTTRPQRGTAGAAAVSGGVQGTEGQAPWCVFGKAAPGKGWRLLGSPGAWALPSILCAITTGRGRQEPPSGTHVLWDEKMASHTPPGLLGKEMPSVRWAAGQSTAERGVLSLLLGVFAFFPPDQAKSRAERPSPPGGQPCVCLRAPRPLGHPGTGPTVMLSSIFIAGPRLLRHGCWKLGLPPMRSITLSAGRDASV